MRGKGLRVGLLAHQLDHQLDQLDLRSLGSHNDSSRVHRAHKAKVSNGEEDFASRGNRKPGLLPMR